MRSRALGSQALVVCAGLLIALTVGGCSLRRSVADPTAPASAAASRVLSDTDLASSLLTEDNLGDAFVAEASQIDVTDFSSGCLSVLDSITRVSFPIREQQVIIHPEAKPQLPAVFHAAATFSTDADAAVALRVYRQKLAGCTRASDVDASGDGTRFTVTHDDERHTRGTDDELNVLARGSVTDGSNVASIVLRYEVVRVGNDVAVIAFATLADDDGAKETEAITDVAVERLAAVTSGREPAVRRLDLQPFGDTGSDAGA